VLALKPNLGLRSPAFARAILAVLIASFASLRADGSKRPEETKPGPRDSFEAADLGFRSFYSLGRSATLAKMGPVIVVEMDKLVLLRDGHRTEATVIPPVYHQLKAVSHVPLALYVALAPFGEGPIDEVRLASLQDFQGQLAFVALSLEGTAFTAEQAARSRSLLKRCGDYLDGVVAERKHDAAKLRALAKAAGPVVLANADDAARAQIDAYHVQVSAWRAAMPDEEWGRLRVLVLGPQMPRKHNVAAQYFAKLLGEPGESRRLVYAEELGGEAQGLNLLATHQLDGELSEAFFGDPHRMESDLLGNAASAYLDRFDYDR